MNHEPPNSPATTPGGPCLEQVDQAIHARQFEYAQTLLESINGNPDLRNLDTLLREAFVLEAQKKFSDAAAIFETAEEVAVVPADKVNILNRISNLLSLHYQDRISADILERMAGFLERSAALDSSVANAETMIKLCKIYQVINSTSDLTRHATRLQEFPEYSLEAHLWLAHANYQLGKKPDGLHHLSYVMPHRAKLSRRQILWLASMLVQFRNFESATELFSYCSAHSIDDELLLELRAQVLFESGDHAGILATVAEETAASCTDAQVRRRLYFYRGKSLEKTGDYAGAHTSYVAMNRVARDVYSHAEQADIVPAYKSLPLDRLPQHAGGAQPESAPVFMIAFPRSGTTLLETILDTQPDVSTLSEVDAVSRVRRKMAQLGKSYPDDLHKLTQSEISTLREVYSDFTGNYLDSTNAGSVVIDKLPLNIVHIPLLQMLFPEAKFILSLRHPYDVCLSCFQQDFALNDEMYFFTTLEGCFTRYREVMNLLQRYRRRLSLNLHIVRYEDIVRDIEATIKGTFEFLGLSHDNSFTSFHKMNDSKVIATPSRSQVILPLYNSSCYRWIHYSDYIKPHAHHVRDLAELYGYPTAIKAPDTPRPGTYC